MNFEILKSTGIIKYVYHISDIHIRIDSRHNEFKEVFERLYDFIKNDIKGKSIIVVTGDVLHSKTDLSPEAITIVISLFDNLSKIAPTIIIPGNHDCNLSNPNSLDSLTPLMAFFEDNTNCHYLKSTGVYQYSNILFGHTSVFSTNFVSANDLDKFMKDGFIKIALYHGPVHGAQTDVGARMNVEEFTSDKFTGYDYVFLGDIHRFQYLNENKTIAYAGSLIQQNYGETLNKHGVLKWDITNGSSKLHEIYNDYGYVNILINDGVYDEKIPIPMKPFIKFTVENTNRQIFEEIVKKIKSKYDVQEVIEKKIYQSRKHASLFTEDSEEDVGKLKINDVGIQEKMIKDFLAKKNTPDDVQEKILELHSDIMKLKNDSGNIIKSMRKWEIIQLEFYNMLSYGKVPPNKPNVINFKKYPANDLIGIVAPNHYGKSAIIDIILFLLFDCFSRGERGEIMNKDSNTMFCSLLLQIGKNKYLIEREGFRGKEGLTVKISVNFYLILDDGTKQNLNGVSVRDTNNKIIELLGTYNDYVATCFMMQNTLVGTSFLEMTQQKRKEYLCELLRLNVFEHCHDRAKERLSEMNVEMKLIKSRFGEKTIDELKKESKKLKKEITSVNSSLEQQQTTYDELYEDVMSYDNSLPVYQEISDYIFDSPDDVDRAIKYVHHEIKHLKKNISYVSQEEIDDNLKKYHELMDKQHKLCSEIVAIPNNLPDEKIIRNRFTELSNSINSFVFKDITVIQNQIDILDKKIDYITSQKSELESTTSKRDKYYKYVDYFDENNKIFIDSFIDEYNDDVYLMKYIRKNNYNHHYCRGKKDGLTFIKEITDDVRIIKELNQVEQMFKHDDDVEINESRERKTKIDECLSFDEKMSIVQHDFISKIDCNIIDHMIQELDTYIRKFNKQRSNLINEINDYRIQYDKLSNQKEQLEIIEHKIRLCESYSESIKQNARVTKELEGVKAEIKKINDCMAANKTSADNKKILESKIKEYDILLLFKTEYDKWYLKKNELAEKKQRLKLIHKEIKSEEVKLNNLVSLKDKVDEEITKYMDNMDDYDNIIKKCNIYQTYINMMNYDGLPYEILISYLPYIQTQINNILEPIVEFNIEFIYDDKENAADLKSRNLRTRFGFINIIINYPEKKPYNVSLASGFERFIIGLAIRLTLCNISMIAKPNFFIIDEGWSCFDKENLTKVSDILNYIKGMYDHVIVISHLDQLKSIVSENCIRIMKHDNKSHLISR